MRPLLSLLLFLPVVLFAEDLTTNSGKTYRNIHDVIIKGEQVSFSTDTDIIKIPLSEMPLDLQTKYLGKSYEAERNRRRLQQQAADEQAAVTTKTSEKNQAGQGQIEAIGNKTLLAIASGMKSIHTNGPAIFSPKNAASLAQLQDAQASAQAQGRPLGFLIVDASLFGPACDPLQPGPEGAFAHLFAAFETGTVLVFLRDDQKAEWQKAPAAVLQILSAPTKTLPVPRLIITDASGRQPIADIQISPTDTADMRDKLIFGAASRIKAWYASMASAVKGN